MTNDAKQITNRQSWPQLYVIVIGALVLEILFFYGLMVWLA
jgi:hypothetical protein